MKVREWSTPFFDDEPIAVTKADPTWTGPWPGKGDVLWATSAVRLPNELNPRLVKGIVHQPEDVDEEFDTADTVGWSLFVPSAVLKADKGKKPPTIAVTLLQGRFGEDVGYGLRVFFERAGTGALLCLTAREGGDKGGRWNQGLGQKTIEGIFTGVGLKGKPEVQVLAGYSTGYGIVQTVNNDLVPLAAVKRLVLFDCLYRCDTPALPKGEPKPVLTTKDQPEFAAPAKGQQVLDEAREKKFQPSPFNTRRAITRLMAASKSCTVAGYSATRGGSPRYCLFTTGKPPTMVRWGTRPVVELARLIELRTQTVTGPSTWSPSDAHDMLLLCRYLDLGVKAGLVKPTDPPAPHRKAIAAGLPPRGTVFASAVSKAITAVPASLPAAPVDLLAWANGLADRPTGKERNTAARIVRDHMLLLPGWFYAYNDLTEYRHGGLLGEFGWELLPP
jgi:hypothetical protein